MEPNLSQKIVRNTIYNIIGYFWIILVALVLAPYTIRHIGIERYGVWAIVGVLTGYFGLLDFGISSSFVKYISEFYTKKDYEKINQVVNTGFAFYTIFTVIITGLGFIFINLLLHIFNIPPALYQEARFVLVMGIIIFCIANALSPFGAVQGGLQRMDITNKINMVFSFPKIIGTVFFLEMGYGLPGLIVNNAIMSVASNIIYIIIAHRILPELRFNPFLFCTKEMFKKLFGFGYKMQIVRLGGTVTTQTDKMLIAYLLSIGLVGFYQLGSTIVLSMNDLTFLLVSALLPAFSEIEARNGINALVIVYLRVTKYLAFIAIPLFIFLIVSASQIMMVWMGPGYGKSILIIQILAIGYMINTIVQPAAFACMAIDKPQAMATGSIIMMILNVFLSIFLINVMGFSGVAWGTTIAIIIGTSYFLLKTKNFLDIPVKRLTKIVIPYIVICLIAATAIWGIDKITNQFNLSVGRLISLVVFIIHGLLFFSIYIIGVYYWKLFDAEDIDFFRKKLPLIGNLVGKSLIRT
jgi:O-antigen/teichoic acid export membrane protein